MYFSERELIADYISMVLVCAPVLEAKSRTGMFHPQKNNNKYHKALVPFKKLKSILFS